ncbi:hypothetical protein GCM10020000_76530 [Streptomyces olivoverticillatus]
MDQVDGSGARVFGGAQGYEHALAVVVAGLAVEQAGELGGAGVGEQVVQAQGAAGAVGDFAQELHGEQGVAARFEEVGAGGRRRWCRRRSARRP